MCLFTEIYTFYLATYQLWLSLGRAWKVFVPQVFWICYPMLPFRRLILEMWGRVMLTQEHLKLSAGPNFAPYMLCGPIIINRDPSVITWFLVAKQLNTHICVCVCVCVYVCPQFCKVWYLPLDDYVWLWMTFYDYAWLCMAMYDYVWLCMTRYDYVWLGMTYDYVCLCMAIYGYEWLCITMYD